MRVLFLFAFKLIELFFSETEDSLAVDMDIASSIRYLCRPFCQQLGFLHHVDLLTYLHEENSSF